MMENKKPPPFYSIALLSASSLAYEVLLMRLFSIIQWHHFAYMIISLALLGYGASGTFLSLTAHRLLPRFPLAYLGNVAMFGLSAVGCYLIAQQVSFNPEEILWDPNQQLRLLLIYLVLTLPFFFVANGIGLALTHYRGEITRVYAADLLGASIGSLSIVLLLFLVYPATALQILGTLGFAAAALASWELKYQPRRIALVLILLSFTPLMLPAGWLALAISPYKGMNQSLQISGTRIIDEYSSPLGLISVMESSQIPLRHAPGLSLNASGEPPSQLGVFTDADAMTVITAHTDERDKLSYLDQVTSALPYHINKPEKILILGAGGGAEVLQANYHGAGHIDAVELNPQIIDLVREKYKDFAGGLYTAANVDVHIAEARGFVSGSAERYDLIQIALLDSFGASSAGLYSLSENYLYTVQALQEYLARLSPGGMLAISRWIKLPPRDTLKLFATAVEALRQSGIDESGNRLVLIRGWQTSTLLVKNSPFSEKEILGIKKFCEARSFDTAYYPGITAAETNRYNVLAEPYFFQGAQVLLSDEAATYLQNYKFNLQPASDDQPYFFHFFKWGALNEILALRGQGGMPLLEWGYLILIATLIQALIASVVLILLPLLLSRRLLNKKTKNISHSRISGYFIALGLAFLFIEIAFIQKFILFLHHPLYATAMVLASFLLFAGLGSAWSQRYANPQSDKNGVKGAVTGIISVGLLYLLALGPLFSMLNWLPIFMKVIISVLLIAPLAFCMGMPFPLGMARLGKAAPAFIPWVWGVNGCASVLSAVIATILAIHFGFTVVVISALMLYGMAMLVFNGGWGKE
ncbi:MAG: SAM-dependent methyltransferase [Gammaproteobacteria bacterium]|nr:SAM-dependent methyltransferase [Gammaproteobacteria bacterium]